MKTPWKRQKEGKRAYIIQADFFSNLGNDFFGLIVILLVLFFLIEGIVWIIGLFG